MNLIVLDGSDPRFANRSAAQNGRNGCMQNILSIVTKTVPVFGGRKFQFYHDERPSSRWLIPINKHGLNTG